MDKFEKMFKALSDRNRLRILKMLEKRQLCVCEITETLGLAASTVSKHLSILRGAGLILSEKNGKWVDYKLNDAAQNIAARQLLSLMPVWLNDDEQVQRDIENVANADRNVICSVEL